MNREELNTQWERNQESLNALAVLATQAGSGVGDISIRDNIEYLNSAQRQIQEEYDALPPETNPLIPKL
jgi:hypothetical protein